MYGEYECFVMHMLYVCVHPVAVLNAAFYMTFSLLILVEDAGGILQSLVYRHECLILFTHPGAVSAFIICRSLCVCIEM